MDFLFLMIACLFFSVQFIFQKCFQKNTKGGYGITVWNQFHIYIFMGVYLLLTSDTPMQTTLTSLLLSVGYAVSGLTSSTGSLFAMRYGKMSSVTTFCLLGGMILPFVYGVLFLHEEVTLWKVLGILVLTGSMLPSLFEKDPSGAERTKGDRVKYFIFCMMTFCGNGMVSVISKAHQISDNAMRLPGGEVDTDGFVLQNALVCLVIAFGILLVRTVMAAGNGDKTPVRSVYYEIGKNKMVPKLFVLLLALTAGYAVCNAVGNIFSLRCAMTMDSSIQFPMLSGVVIFMTAVFGWLFFREKIGKSNLLSLTLTLIGISLFMIPV
ncbi:MAG: hypothetical protein E7631_00225 [Ruminococcaceae bacterium]|nr:hypothetical protein [Oscillospiraceae bacterium]